MSDIISANNGIITRGRTEDGKFYVHTTYLDDSIIKDNIKIANTNNLSKMKLSLHHGEDVRGVIRCPSIEQWTVFKTKNPQIAEDLSSSHEYDRINALKQISLKEPTWVIMKRL